MFLPSPARPLSPYRDPPAELLLAGRHLGAWTVAHWYHLRPLSVPSLDGYDFIVRSLKSQGAGISIHWFCLDVLPGGGTERVGLPPGGIF